ncbi:hypothetical protein C8Q79DRAFT_987156 [Trametes meyenii]|nr:hypothetical protein C8Q79DRAFT_987156 [Trametes meyenii]
MILYMCIGWLSVVLAPTYPKPATGPDGGRFAFAPKRQPGAGVRPARPRLPLASGWARNGMRCGSTQATAACASPTCAMPIFTDRLASRSL